MQKARVGFVPTMGALHEGHVSLLRKCRRENDIVVVSIFVNPKQFSPSEDLATYPRQKKLDEKLCKNNNVDIIICPTERKMYPLEFCTYVETRQLSNVLCGKARPRHFTGVTTVVAKLLNIVQPDRMYLGQKDAQQAVILKRMVKDLNFAVMIKICPTIREKDGLAISSRNKHLTSKQRVEATKLFEALKDARTQIRKGERKTAAIVKMIKSRIKKETSGTIDYVQCVALGDLSPQTRIKSNTLIALAVKFKKTRLIDNIIVRLNSNSDLEI